MHVFLAGWIILIHCNTPVIHGIMLTARIIHYRLVQSAAALVLTRTRRRDDINPAVAPLH